MLKIKTKIKESKIHGIGLFADEFIPKGTITWSYDADFDVGFSKETIDSLTPLQKNYFLFYCYFDKSIQKFILCCDSQRFINHSQKLENILSETRMDIAARDIQPGEELLCDYNKFDSGYWERHGIDPQTLN